MYNITEYVLSVGCQHSCIVYRRVVAGWFTIYRNSTAIEDQTAVGERIRSG